MKHYTDPEVTARIESLVLILRQRRKSCGMTQTYLAGKIGMSVKHLNGIENHKIQPTLSMLSMIATGLGQRVYVTLVNIGDK